MAKGASYFVWVDAGTPWSNDFLNIVPGHADYESVFSFAIGQSEGDFCTLTITIRNPKVGLLNASIGRKIWAWFALDCGSGGLFKMFCRLVGIPSNIFGEKVTLDFVAKPSDYETQKALLAEDLKVLPFYDRAFIDPQREADDIDSVLEGYTKIWHIDRETHALTVSDEISGEDGTIILEPDELLYNGLDMRMPTTPISRVTVPATFNWTQMAQGSGIDFARYIAENWPHIGGTGIHPYRISSYTFGADSWPQAGTSIGRGWSVVYSAATPVDDLEIRHHSEAGKMVALFPSGPFTLDWPTEGNQDAITAEHTLSFDYIGPLKDWRFSPDGSIDFPMIITQDETQVQYGDDGDGGREIINLSHSSAATRTVIPLQSTNIELELGYDAKRPFTEFVRFTLTADVQPALTDPDDDMVLLLPELNSIDLSTVVGGDTDSEMPIGDTRARSYLALDRGQQSLRYLLCLARATLLKRARCVEVTVWPLLETMPQVSLRKNMLVVDSRIPGGEALGKITGYAMALDGESGALTRSVTMQCCIGRGGSHTFTAGEALYVDADYVDNDWQEFSDEQLTIDDDIEDVGFTRPLFGAQDDGLNFFAELTAEDIIEVGLAVTFTPEEQRDALEASDYFGVSNQPGQNIINFPIGTEPTTVIQERNAAIRKILEENQTEITFTLRSMEGFFNADYEIEVTNLKVPKQIDLETSA